MSATTDIFSQLAERVCKKIDPIYVKILENQLTPREAKILVGIADKKNEAVLAESLNMDPKTLAATIDDLKNRRYIVTRQGVLNIPGLRFFPRGPFNMKTRELWTEFFRRGDFQKIRAEELKVSLQALGAPSWKVIPAHQAFLASPNIDPGQILWYENMEGIFKRTRKRWQFGLKPDGTLGTRDEGGCPDRSYWTDSCDHPGGCTFWEWESGTWGADATNRNSSKSWFTGRPGFERREITIEEALAACHKMEDAGQIHMSPNSAQASATCNCCPCCCGVIQPMKNYGDIYKMLAPSRYLAVIDEKKCQEGCRICLDRCYFDAIEIRKTADSRMKAFIINEHCLGCGLCIYKCPTQAMRFELVRPPAHIPTFPLPASM